MTALLKERRMFLGILVVLSCLSISALGQTVTTPTECTNAVTTFTQSMECFGTQTGLNGFLALLNSTSGSTDITRNAALNSAERQALAIFYNNFCTKQACINAYANAYQPCYDAQFRQLNSNMQFDFAAILDLFVLYACAKDESDQFCAVSQLDHSSDFQIVTLCTLTLNSSSASCTDICAAARRVRPSLCCINSIVTVTINLARSQGVSAALPDTSQVFTNCGETNPGMCATALTNPFSGGHRVMQSWGLLAAVLVSVKVILAVII